MCGRYGDCCRCKPDVSIHIQATHDGATVRVSKASLERMIHEAVKDHHGPVSVRVDITAIHSGASVVID